MNKNAYHVENPTTGEEIIVLDRHAGVKKAHEFFNKRLPKADPPYSIREVRGWFCRIRLID